MIIVTGMVENDVTFVRSLLSRFIAFPSSIAALVGSMSYNLQDYDAELMCQLRDELTEQQNEHPYVGVANVRAGEHAQWWRDNWFQPSFIVCVSDPETTSRPNGISAGQAVYRWCVRASALMQIPAEYRIITHRQSYVGFHGNGEWARKELKRVLDFLYIPCPPRSLNKATETLHNPYALEGISSEFMRTYPQVMQLYEVICEDAEREVF